MPPEWLGQFFVLAAPLSEVFQIQGDVPVTVHATTFEPGLFDQPNQSTIGLGAGAFRAMQPSIETTEVDLQHAAHDPDPELLLVSPDEAILSSDSLAKNAAAFNMSRSSVTRRSSARS
ncbi:hypothetical protein BN2364_0756 [Alloalcanivorax xenomutans]|jgi:hypothetical protein|nr:hypothetical protein [Alcanivorax sp.]CUR45197.1 hypothetical protein BN2364_0756 [Alloalcanivorax xenomutans]|tara:strand:+ start:47765 stop:48118 length:354 start_codon:yes stop_codon:yes gene_type:complete